MPPGNARPAAKTTCSRKPPQFALDRCFRPPKPRGYDGRTESGEGHSMRVLRAVLLVAAAAMIAGPAVAAKKKQAAPPCVKGKLLTAFQMRMMQTELVVGALSCKLTPRYNDFVRAYQSELMTAHRALEEPISGASRSLRTTSPRPRTKPRSAASPTSPNSASIHRRSTTSCWGRSACNSRPSSPSNRWPTGTIKTPAARRPW